MSSKRMLCEVWKTDNGIVTVTTNTGGGSGTRLCGIKLYASGSRKVAKFYLDEHAVESIVEDFAQIPDDGGGGAT